MGLRLVYVPQEFGGQVKRNELSLNSFKFKFKDKNDLVQFKQLEVNKVKEQKAFYIFDKQTSNNLPGFLESLDTEYFKQYNPIPIIDKEVDISDFINLGELNKSGILEQIFNKKYFKVLKEQIRNDDRSKAMIDYGLLSDIILGLFVIHSSLVLNGEQMKTLFDRHKRRA